MSLQSKAIVIGGPIAVGKSSLVGSLPFVPVQELDANDELQRLLIEKMYEGDPVAPHIFQLDILLTRFDKYKKLANSEERHVFDRSIFEDRYFAQMLFKNYPNIWNYYNGIWEDKIKLLMEEIGKPEFYVLLTCSWETFKERVFMRNRKPEIENFTKNEAYFKEMLNGYEAYMIDVFKEYDLAHVFLNTDELSRLEVIEVTKKELAKRGIL